MTQIHLRSVSVQLPIYDMSKRSLKKDFLRIATGGSVAQDANQHVVITALNNINVSFYRGDQIGLVGHNGSGKSTLLRLLARIYEPTIGKISIEGYISPLLDISLGVELEFTGYENIYIRGTLLGLSRHQIKERMGEINE